MQAEKSAVAKKYDQENKLHSVQEFMRIQGKEDYVKG